MSEKMMEIMVMMIININLVIGVPFVHLHSFLEIVNITDLRRNSDTLERKREKKEE